MNAQSIRTSLTYDEPARYAAVSNTMPQPGDLIDGRYRVQRALGAGSMGAIYEVSHHVTGKRFALKRLNPELTKVPGAVERFIREAKIGAQFEHPNFIEVYDIGQDADSLFIVMELLEGEPLSERLTKIRRLKPRTACELLCPCMEAIALAHAAGVIHRDLKPANIFVCKSSAFVPEHARVLDFGVSKLASDSQLHRHERTLTTPGMVLGTLHYMAPEQMRGEKVDARADVYAFGVILYEVLSGEHPFQAQSFAGVLAQVLKEPPRSLHRVAGVPERLAEIVAKAMAREPADRFDSMAALLEALTPFRSGSYEQHPVPSRVVPSLQIAERAAMPRAPRKSNAGSIAAFVAAVGFVVAGSWAARKHSAEQAPETVEATLPEANLANRDLENPALEPATKVRELEAIADARDTTKPTKAARDPERVAVSRRRSSQTRRAVDEPSSAPAGLDRDTLKERPITFEQLSNGLIDPFGESRPASASARPHP